MKKTLSWGKIIFAAILVSFVVYAGLFIWHTRLDLGGATYFSLFDDEMISMRYAKNLVHGYGLVFNPGGERVEGYTNLLWVLYMALFHLLPIAASKISLTIQISGGVFLFTSLFFVHKIAKKLSNGSYLVANIAVLLTAFYYPLVNWSLQGLEVSVLILMVAIAAWLGLQAMEREKTPYGLLIMLGVGTLVRLDVAVVAGAVTLCLLFFGPRSQWRKTLLTAVIIVGAFLVGQTLFRVLYYGDWVPNTYTLKMVGYPLLYRLSRGLYIFLKFVWLFNWALFLLPFLVVIKNRRKDLWFLVIVFFLQVLYSIYVGGDAWEWFGGSNRYISIVMPLFFVLFAFSVGELLNALRKALSGSSPWMLRALPLVAVASVVLSLVSFNSLLDIKSLKLWALIDPPLHVGDDDDLVYSSLLINSFTTENARIAVVQAGIEPYFGGDRTYIDILGKNDKYIANLPMRFSEDQNKWIGFYPGHMKWDYAYSIGTLKPDVIADLYKDESEADPYLTDYVEYRVYSYSFYLRKDSKNILWDLVK